MTRKKKKVLIRVIIFAILVVRLRIGQGLPGVWREAS